jgi:hypothetical protein
LIEEKMRTERVIAPSPHPAAILRLRRRRFAEVMSRLCLTFSFQCLAFG